jgi:hypothetical protein
MGAPGAATRIEVDEVCDALRALQVSRGAVAKRREPDLLGTRRGRPPTSWFSKHTGREDDSRLARPAGRAVMAMARVGVVVRGSGRRMAFVSQAMRQVRARFVSLKMFASDDDGRDFPVLGCPTRYQWPGRRMKRADRPGVAAGRLWPRQWENPIGAGAVSRNWCNWAGKLPLSRISRFLTSPSLWKTENCANETRVFTQPRPKPLAGTF